MELTRLSRGIIVLPVLIAASSIFFESGVALIAASAIAFSLFWRYAVFDRRVRNTLATCRIERKLAKTIVRQGGIVPVTARCVHETYPGMQVEITEMLPHGGKLASGSAGPALSDRGECSLAYSVAFQVHGDSIFPGIRLRLCDPFFKDEFLLTCTPVRGPEIAVQPTGDFEPLSGYKGYGEEEIERIRAISGHGIRGYREFYQGDDMRHIDWKLTAKHGRMMLREYATIGESYPLIVMDLPPVPVREDDKRFEAMVGAVAGAVERSLNEFRHMSLLLVSGPNVVRMYPDERRFHAAMQVIRTDAHPVPRQRTLYRFMVRSEIDARARATLREALSSEDPEIKAYLKAVGDIYRSAAEQGEVHAFQGEVSRAIGTTIHDEILIFSLCDGDTSHIRMMVEQMHRQKKKVLLRVPFCTGDPDMSIFRKAFRVESVEAIPCR